MKGEPRSTPRSNLFILLQMSTASSPQRKLRLFAFTVSRLAFLNTHELYIHVLPFQFNTQGAELSVLYGIRATQVLQVELPLFELHADHR